ncbi:hypothetical protein LY39_03699 [Roseinatronobacter bogoriensis subsp. barguzinensis]|nr:hypothetical protein [Rhodobaca bogoriensis DSM 18756]TDW33047.1 hypothetical protein LY39_03699 [Rhodobaca barguzinensis]TDY65884.1 hypothetical protein EV660_11639 [Rhodobaca bogoriensis DSM 18756]
MVNLHNLLSNFGGFAAQGQACCPLWISVGMDIGAYCDMAL